MTNFLAELWDACIADVPTYLKPLAVLIIITMLVPAMLFAFILKAVQWFMELSPNKRELALRLAFNVGLQPFMVWIFFDSLIRTDLFASSCALLAFAVLVVTIPRDLRDWQKWRL